MRRRKNPLEFWCREFELIDQLVSYDAPLANNLRRLAEGFNYQELLELLPSEGE